jgi:hypothetical protein
MRDLEPICRCRSMYHQTRSFRLLSCSTTLLLRHGCLGGHRYVELPDPQLLHRKPSTPFSIFDFFLRRILGNMPTCSLVVFALNCGLLLTIFANIAVPLVGPKAFVRVALKVTSPPLSKMSSTISIANVSLTVLNPVSVSFCTMLAID